VQQRVAAHNSHRDQQCSVALVTAMLCSADKSSLQLLIQMPWQALAIARNSRNVILAIIICMGFGYALEVNPRVCRQVRRSSHTWAVNNSHAKTVGV
jgi:hypothetical protein